MKVLVITVGGSCAPLVTSIRQNKPDMIYFLCSEDSVKSVNGKGNVCGKDSKNPDQPNVLTQCGIAENEERKQFFIHIIKNKDNLNDCYVDSLKILNEILRDNINAEIIVDYTGGTKSMSGGLAVASHDFCGIKLCVVTGERNDLIKVQDGTQRIKLTQTNFAFLNRQFEQAKKLMDRYDYEGALTIFDEVIKVPDIPENFDKKIQRLFLFSRAYLAWDHFDHVKAWELLYQNRGVTPENVMFLEAVVSSRIRFDKGLNNSKIEGISLSPKGCGYELVEDLVLNAERRASQGRYDDAVGRLYRAMEMLVQIHLCKNHSIDTGNIDLERLPETLKAEYKARKGANGKVEMGLQNSYELLNKLNSEDELGKLYVRSQKKLNNSLSIRNKSLFAHGMTPISNEQYEIFYEAFVKEVLDPFLNTLGKMYAKRNQFATTEKLLEKI
ncbi:MAG: TIGR02710 family CRISPR-associated CARF protein [Methanosarcina sp.]|jgi:CRISPR-associated protein (TIGR02710 family)